MKTNRPRVVESPNLHGKEGVDGSSPSEGSAKAAQIAAFSVGQLHELQYAVGMEPGYGAFRFKRPLTTPRIRTRSRRLDEAAFERHAD